MRVVICIVPLFQFHKGTIRTIIRFVNYNGDYYFNSIKVRLELLLLSLFLLLLAYFNSIKVRLEQGSGNDSIGEHLFQFHKGTIRTLSPVGVVLEYNSFQFHKGTIRTMVNHLISILLLISIP